MAGIFRAYDIRGVYSAEISEHIARDIGAAFATLNPGKIVIGSDTRLSSPALKAAFIEGATAAGADIVDIGNVTTPVVTYATKWLAADGGVAITASHNPKEYNGIKLNDKAGVPISYESGLSKIEEIVKTKKFKVAIKPGGVTMENVLPRYLSFLAEHAPLRADLQKLRLVVDCGNGVAGAIYPAALERLGCQVVRLYCEPDGSFPHHLPDPEKEENLKDLQKKVKAERADLGVAYDGDGDRVGFVDERGQIVSTTKILSLLIKDVLCKRKGGAKIVYDTECSRAIEDVIKAGGGIGVPCRTGHTYITQRLLAEQALFAGEKSGHYYYKKTGGVDDGLFATLRLLSYLIRTHKKLSEAVAGLPEYVSSYRRLPVPDEKKFQAVEQIGAEVVRQGYKPLTLDGVRVNLPAGWFLVRASNTEPKISVTCEATTKDELARIEQFVNGLLRKVGVPL